MGAGGEGGKAWWDKIQNINLFNSEKMFLITNVSTILH